jgi:hypothetical protein
MIRGRKVGLALDLKFSGKLRQGQRAPQMLYSEDSLKQLVLNDSTKYEKSKHALL